MVQAQAMACGLPIICSENTGGSEIVDHGINGYVIPIKNIEILKNKIQEFYYVYNLWKRTRWTCLLLGNSRDIRSNNLN